MAQELLSTFGSELGGVTLVPGTGGIFEIRVDGALVWERKRDGGFPDVKALKQRVRDAFDPERDLGHLDRLRAELTPLVARRQAPGECRIESASKDW